MPAQRKYPEELRERAVKMVFEVREREGRGRGEIARVAQQLGIHREAPGRGSGRQRLMAGRGRAPRQGNRGGSLSWNAKYASCAGRMRY